MKRPTKHAATVEALRQSARESFTVAEFRDRIAAMLRAPGTPPRFRNSVSECCRRKKGSAPTPSEVMMLARKGARK